VKEVLTELAKADRRGYRSMLREKCERLEDLAERLERLARPEAHAS
jgi:hypothetical protein